MANNCCSGNECEELVTIGYMRSIISSTDVKFPCVDVSDAEGYDDCCEADESAYTPTYGDIMIEVSPNKGKYANIRKIDRDDPIRDINGFSARTTSTPIESCCGELDPNDALIPKSDFLFGWTVIQNIDFDVTKPASVCDPNYVIKETDVYHRCFHSCDFEEAEGAYVIISTVSASTEISGSVTKNYGNITPIEGSCSATCEVTFDNARIYTSITTCDVTKSAETSFTLNQYEVVVGLLPYDGNNGKIPCEGGIISGNVVSECLNEVNIISMDISRDIDAQISSLFDDGHFEITIPRNDNGYSDIEITINFSVGSKSGSISSCTYGWDACEYRPSTDNPCEIFWNIRECWNIPSKNMKEYDCEGNRIECNN